MWSAPVEITSTFDPFRPELDWQVIATGPGHAVQLRCGRMVAPFWMATYENKARLKKAVGVICSDDHGSTWQRGDIALRNAGEPNLAETSDGQVIVTARNSDPRNRRLAAYSDLAVLPDGVILCFYESGDPASPQKSGRDWAYAFLTLARFNLEWLTEPGKAFPNAGLPPNQTRKEAHDPSKN